jgi:hypothetical protein
MFKVPPSSQQAQDLSSETFVELVDKPGVGTVERHGAARSVIGGRTVMPVTFHRPFVR